ncbi:MAG: hypothetical protein J5780_05635 [Treponema sp.]|nr:hypothetical protein [Treponema sp.]
MKNLKKILLIAAGVVLLAAGATISVFAVKGSGSGLEAKVSEDFNAEPLSVVFVSPSGLIENDIRYPEIQIQFSDPVVALSALGNQSDKCDYAKIEPALSGYWKWTGTSTLSFVCRDAIIPQKMYSIHIMPNVKSIYGKKITGKLDYEFYAEKLRILSVIPGYSNVKEGNYVDNASVPLEQAKDIGLVFNTEINIDTVKQFISVYGSYSGEKTFSIRKESATTLVLSVKENFAENEEVTIVLKAGAQADKDTIALDSDVTNTFETLRSFSVTDCYLNTWNSEYSNPIFFYFSAPLKEGSEAEAAKYLTTNIDDFTVTKDNVAVSGNRLILHNVPVYYNSYLAVTLKAGLKDIYGRTLEEGIDKKIFIPPASGLAYFKNSGFKILESQFDPKIAFAHQNVTSGFYGVTPITSANGSPRNASEDYVSLNIDEIPRDTKIIQAVDLKKYLEKTGEQYRGSIIFRSKLYYDYYYRHWRTGNYEREETYNSNDQAIQVTDLGVTVRYGYNKASVLVSSLSTGKPVANAKVNIYNYSWRSSYSEILAGGQTSQASAVTDSNGLAVVDLHGVSKGYLYVEAVTENDRVIFNPDLTGLWRFGIDNYSPQNAGETSTVPFIFTDRGLYKPGEKVTFRIIDRRLQYGEYSVPEDCWYKVELKDNDYYHSTVYDSTDGYLDECGTTWGEFVLPEDIRPGTYAISYIPNSSSSSYECYIQVQFFERLRYEVKTSAPDIDVYRGDTVSVDVSANYLGGGSMAGSSYEASWSREPCGFSLKDNRFKNMMFGPIQDYEGRSSLGQQDGALGENGSASLTQKTGGERINGLAYNYRVNVEVLDAGNQAISSSKTVTVHPAKFYIGVESLSKGGYPKKGTDVRFSYICVDPHGESPAPLSLPSNLRQGLTIELLREDYKLVQQMAWDGQINTRYVQELVSESKETVALSGKNIPTQFSVKPSKGGRYLLRLSAIDSSGNDVITEKYFYVTGGDWYWYSRNNSTEISITPDKGEYEPGETAQLLMQSPVEKGTYMLTVEREGIWTEKVIEINEPTSVIEVPIEEKYLPVVYVTLSTYTVRKGKPEHDFNSVDLDKPKGCFGAVELCVSKKSRTFDIKIIPDKTSYRPGDKATVKVVASKNGEKLSGAQITLMGVDRGVVDLINYHVPDPVEFFYSKSRFPNRVYGGDSRSLLIDPVTYEIKNLIGGDSDDAKLQERKNFDPTAVFIPSIKTDANGEATCTFTWPDTLTAYRLTAVGVRSNDFAITEDEVSVANPVSVRQVLPRKLRLGDNCDLGVVISNISNTDYNVNVSLSLHDGVENTPAARDSLGVLRTAGNASVEGNSDKNLLVPADTTKPLLFNVKAHSPGWVTLEFVVKSPVVNERILLPLEIEKPYIFETTASIGSVDKDDAKEMIEVPIAEDGFGSFYIQLDPTRLGALREAVDYVFRYPYGCMEQRSSKVLPLIAFGDYLEVFNLKREVTDAVDVARNEIKSWENVQKSDGGFPYWPTGRESNFYVSARIAEILGLAKQKNIYLNAGIDERHLADYVARCCKEEKSGTLLKAYGYYAANLLGREVSADELSSLEEGSEANVIILSYLALVHLNSNRKNEAVRIMQKIRNRITLTPQGADIQDKYDNWWWCDGGVEKYAAALMLFVKMDAKDSINDHLVFELLKLHGNKGYWKSTSTTARVLIAIDAYIRARNLTSLDFTASAHLGGKQIAEGSFKGVGANPVSRTIDFDQIKSFVGKEVPLTFKRKGEGTLYYTMALKYALPVDKQIPRDEGICLYSEIFDAKTGELVSGAELEEGKVYKEKVYISSTKDLEYVALRVPVPAGAEILNAAFVTTSPQANRSYDDDDYGSYYDDYYWGWSLSNRDIYDSEVQYFWNRFYRGNTSVDFLFRATRTGTYNTPCITAECMYEEEIFGRTAGKLWTIK